MNGFTTSFMG